MARLVQISEAANLAIHALACLATHTEGRLASASSIAGHLGKSEAHLSKVLMQLAKVGLVKSSRGARGGFALARDPEDVTLLEIVEMFDGPILQEKCLLGKEACREGSCVLQPMLNSVSNQVRDYLKQTRLNKFNLEPIQGESDEQDSS